MCELINTYYPNTSDKEVMHELLTVKIGKSNEGLPIYTPYCGSTDLNTLVFHTVGAWDTNIDLANRRGLSKLSWKEIYELVDIKTKKDFEEYNIKYPKY